MDFQVKRGTCFAVNGNTAYLYTHGIATSVRNPNFKYIPRWKKYTCANQDSETLWNR